MVTGPFFQCGPSGGLGGNEFEDDPPDETLGVFAILLYSGNVLDSIQLEYTNRSRSDKHGGNGGNPGNIPGLEFNEHIIELDGTYGDYIDMLNIRTNLRSFGPFGLGGGPRTFLYHVPDGFEIIGFVGASGSYVDSLGIRYRPIPQSPA